MMPESHDIPTTLESLVTRYLPATFAAAKAGRGVGSYHGHCVVRDGERAWTLAVRDGELVVEAGATSDAVGEIALKSTDFPTLMTELVAAFAKNRSLAGAEPFSLSERSAAEIRQMPGSVAIEIRSETHTHELRASFGSTSTASDATCQVAISMPHLLAVVSGELHPLQLLFRGDLQVTGDTSLPTQLGMALLAPE